MSRLMITVAGPVLLTIRPAEATTVLLTVEELLALLASAVVLETLAVLLMVEPLASLALAFTTRLKMAVTPDARVGALAVMVPVPPTAGVVTANPAVPVNDTKV